jgi:hypothetical protein
MNWFVSRDSKDFADCNVVNVSLNMFVASNIDLFQTLQYHWVSTCCIVELCFVFYFNHIVDVTLCCEDI